MAILPREPTKDLQPCASLQPCEDAAADGSRWQWGKLSPEWLRLSRGLSREGELRGGSAHCIRHQRLNSQTYHAVGNYELKHSWEYLMQRNYA